MRVSPFSLLLSLAMLFMVFGSAQLARAEVVAKRSHIIIAADHSGSMHNIRAIHVQTEAIITALYEYVSGCGNTTITYIAWGTGVRPPVSADLNNREELGSLMIAISELSAVNLVGSNHNFGFSTAQAAILPNERAIVIFLTDDKASEYEVEGIDFELHKVAIVRPGVAETLRKYFLPGKGTVHEVHSTEELETLVKDLLEKARTELCLG